MAARTVLSKWIGEYCAPVVVTVATSEAENICLKNGLLLHELLSSFGHLDSLNTTIRVGNQSFYISDAHIRFERVTELRGKNGELVEEFLGQSFEEFDITKLPNNVPELKSSPPTSWTPTAEQIVMRSMSFSEFEMISHPLVILTVVACSDVDHVACMQELASAHHTPTLFSSGQYDPQVHRVFLLLNDATSEKKFDSAAILKRLQTKFPPANTLMLTVNSFPANAPNLQQPDMWSRFLIPKYFPQHAPTVDPSVALPLHPVTGVPVLGCRLNMDDFMHLRQFCIDLFNHQIVPCIERRIAALNRQVTDARKGVKNWMKSVWRKPRDETEGTRGGVKYRYDKVESQIVQLADISFMIKDFETAVSMYKLVRDDFKADKSTLHLAHTSLMMAACYMMTEPNKYKELHSHLEALGQVLAAPVELPHANAYFALLAAEMYVYNHNTRAPLESAKILLQAAANLSRYPLLNGMLTERAAIYYMQANQSRKYVLYAVVAGNRFLRKPGGPSRHAAVCFACCMLMQDKSHWGDIKTKLMRALAVDYRDQGREGAQRSLLLMLRVLSAVLDEKNDVGIKASQSDAVAVFNEVVSEGAWGSILIGEGWQQCLTRQTLLGTLPIGPMNILSNDISKHRCEVVGLGLPSLDKSVTALVNPMYGYSAESRGMPNQSVLAEELRVMLDVEVQWVEEFARWTTSGGDEIPPQSLSDRIADAEQELSRLRSGGKQSGGESGAMRVPLGEEVLVRLKLTNKLPVELVLTKVALVVEPQEHFEAPPVELLLHPDSSSEVVLAATPQQVGQFRVDSARWNLSDFFSVRQPLKRKGPLLQRSLQQRVNRERGPDTSMQFEVIAPHPLLKISFEGLSPEVLQGQLLKSKLVLRNEGACTACDIFMKFSQPQFILYSTDSLCGASALVPFHGQSSTVVKLPEGTIILPGQELCFDAWLRVTKPGLQTISLLSAYKALREDGSKDFFGPGARCRTSFVSVQTRGLPSVGASMRLVTRSSSTVHHALIAEVANFLRAASTTGNGGESAIRNSLGQIVLESSVEQFADIEDGGVKVAGVVMLGAAEPFAHKPTASAAHFPHTELLAAPSERVVGCFPVKFVDCLQQGCCTAGQTSWLQPLSRSASPDEMASVLQTQLVQVMEQFLCIVATSEQLDRDVAESRKLMRSEAIEADKTGPRTIAQVRRDRQRQENSLRSDGAANRDGGGDSDSDLEDFHEELEDVALECPAASTAEALVAVANPSSLAEIATNEALSQSITVAMLWVCRWEGQIRWGMHSVPNMSFVGVAPSTASSFARNKNPSDFLMVGLHYSPRVELSAAQQPHLETVPVRVTLKSVSNLPLLLDVEAVDEQGSGSELLFDKLEKTHNTGVRWGGKTRHTGLLLGPHSTTDLHLSAVVSQPGVYDLNRFKILVNYSEAVSDGALSMMKNIAGQCLLEVVEPAMISI